MRQATLALAAAWMVAATALAHGRNGVHLMGTLKAVAAQALTVETTDQGTVDVAVDDKTRFDRAGRAIGKDALVVGERVVVHAQKVGSAGLRAELVKVAKAAAPDGGAP